MRSFPFYLSVTALAICLPALSVQSSAETAQERAKEILRQVDDMWRGKSSAITVTMRVKTAHYTRTLTMQGWSQGKEKTLVRILSPLKEKGTATLKSGKTIYTYLPKTDRTIRLTSGMMMGSWMGSHFTNDDLVKESRMEEDYHPEVSFEGERDGVELLEFTLIPKRDAAVVWGKKIMTVHAKGFIPIRETYYDEDMKIVRTITFSGIKVLGGRRLATILRVVPEDKPDEYTELIYEKMEFDVKLKNGFFSLARLKRR